MSGSSLKIAIVSTPFIRVPPVGYGGTELFCYELSEELVRRGHDVTLFTTGDSTTSAKKRSFYPHAEWPPNAGDELNHTAWAVQEIEQGGFDVAHLNMPLGVPFSRFMSAPTIYTIHHKREEMTSRIFAAHQDVTYVAISERQREIEIPLARSTVVHHGLSESRYPITTKDEGYLLHLGRYANEKGTDTAIDIARAAGMRLLLAGRVHDVDHEFYEKKVAPKLASGIARDVGEADHEKKVALLGGARALVSPLRWEEPFGLVAIEAMLCGAPVVGFARGSYPEIVDEGVTGFLVPDGDVDAMIAAVKNLDGFDRARCAARARERFTAAVMTTKYEAIYRRAIARLGAVRAA